MGIRDIYIEHNRLQMGSVLDEYVVETFAFEWEVIYMYIFKT